MARDSSFYLKFFLSKNGVPTRRIAGTAGTGHLDLANEILRSSKVEPGTDLYQQMFQFGYARVVETDTEILVDAPKPLSKHQSRWLRDKSAECHKSVNVNNRAFIESRAAQRMASAMLS